VAGDGKLAVLTSPGVLAAPGVQVFANAATDPAGPPTPADSDLYYNNVLRDWMEYDGGRAKWLSITTLQLVAGRRGNISTGTFLRGVGTLVLDAGNRGIPCQKGTIVYLAVTRTDAGLATIEVLNNGGVVATLATSVAGPQSTTAINVDVASGLLSFRNAAVGSAMSNVQIALGYKRRI